MNTTPKQVRYHNGVRILTDGTFYAVCTVCYGMGCETCKGVGEGYDISRLPTSFPVNLICEFKDYEDENDGCIDWQEIDEAQEYD